ncbi:uncharacterized protein LOC127007025 isoform X2 [Eriocheir sinensis]|uniref:uncharacterized protein LOC127007025 isoform X2 n=1 Tax=Eriocheir sinensis TaxID=95602 RepID=UPI0021C77A90|nr:uncharacterized protein LOC127007025 isoform X2 [Eriocheir sinensis]
MRYSDHQRLVANTLRIDAVTAETQRAVSLAAAGGITSPAAAMRHTFISLPTPPEGGRPSQRAHVQRVEAGKRRAVQTDAEQRVDGVLRDKRSVLTREQKKMTRLPVTWGPQALPGRRLPWWRSSMSVCSNIDLNGR